MNTIGGRVSLLLVALLLVDLTTSTPTPKTTRSITFVNHCSHESNSIWVSTDRYGLFGSDKQVIEVPHDGTTTIQIPSGSSNLHPSIPVWEGRLWVKNDCDAQGQQCKRGQQIPPCRIGSNGHCEYDRDNLTTNFHFMFMSYGNTFGPSKYDIYLPSFDIPIEIVPSNPNCASLAVVDDSATDSGFPKDTRYCFDNTVSYTVNICAKPKPIPGARIIKFINNCINETNPIWISSDRPGLFGINKHVLQVLPQDASIVVIPNRSGDAMIPDWEGRLWVKNDCDSQGQQCRRGQQIPPCRIGETGACEYDKDDLTTNFYFTLIPYGTNKRHNLYSIGLNSFDVPIRIIPSTSNCESVAVIDDSRKGTDVEDSRTCPETTINFTVEVCIAPTDD